MIPVVIYGGVSTDFRGESCALPFNSKNQSNSLDGSFYSTWVWLQGNWLLKRWVWQRNAKATGLVTGCRTENTFIANTSKSTREKIKSGYVSFLQAIFLPRLQESILFSCLIKKKKKKSQSVIVKTSSGKCNSLTRNYMSYLSPLKLLLQEVECIALERVPLMFVRGASPWLCSSFLPTVSPKDKCKPRSGPT